MKKLASFASSVGLFAAVLLPTPSVAAWNVGSIGDGEGFHASTTNDSGNVFGQFCYVGSSTCYYLVGFSARCEEREQYPVLINADSGASNEQILCIGKVEIDGRTFYRYAFTNFDNIDKVVRESSRLGIAIPLERDQFRVLRFDLVGSSNAVDRMRARANRAIEGSTTSPRKTTRDQVL